MRIEEVATRIQSLRPDLERFGVRSLSVFGSTARGDPIDDSDVDFLVEFSGPTTFRGYMGLKHLLETAMGRQVDLATPKMLRDRTRASILSEAVRVAW